MAVVYRYPRNMKKALILKNFRPLQFWSPARISQKGPHHTIIIVFCLEYIIVMLLSMCSSSHSCLVSIIISHAPALLFVQPPDQKLNILLEWPYLQKL